MAKDLFQVKLATADPGIARKLSDLLRSAKFFEVVGSSDHCKADLLVFQLGENAAADLQQALAAVQNGEANELFLVSDTADSKILMQAMRAGVKEFFTQPLNPVEIKEALNDSRKGNHRVGLYRKSKRATSSVCSEARAASARPRCPSTWRCRCPRGSPRSPWLFWT